jgi:DNA repair protein SbcC/Rad50
MRLIQLKLKNFRPFESVDLDLNADGLIGIRGLNGAGKSSLLAAIEWALYGQRRGAGSVPPRRAGAPSGERCQVELQFAFDGHHYEVTRNEKKAQLRIDGDVVAQTLTETTNAVVTHLGISRDSFASTFYARQREIEALKPQADDDKRRRQLEDLLGLTRLRTASRLARQETREQELVVRTLESEAIDQDEAKKLLAELEAHVKEQTPAVEARRHAKEQAQASKDAAWQALTGARERAEQALNAESAAAIAEAEANQASERADETTAALQAAREAATALEELEPVVSRAPELRARDGELEAHRQTDARVTKLRERKHTAEKRGAVLADQLEALAPIVDTPAALAQLIAEAEEALERVTERRLKLGADVPVAAANARAARARANALSEIEQLAPAIAELNELRQEQAPLVNELASIAAEEHELRRTLAEETSHREEIERDGEAARCLRCKRPYGPDFPKIILQYDALIASLDARMEAMTSRAAVAQERQQALAVRVDKLAAAETRKAALESHLASEPVESADALEEQVQLLADEQTQLHAEHGQQETHLKDLRRRRDAVAASAEQRQQVEQAIREAAAEAELFARELAELPENGYDAEAHAVLREELAAVLAADERARPLRSRAAELPLLERRLGEEQEQSQAKAERAKTARQVAHGCAPDREALATAQAAFEAADKALAGTTNELKEVEEQALRENAEVQAARASLDQARKQGLRLKKERLELRYRFAAAEVLKEYCADAQRRAFPTVARETSELLAALTHGRYSEAQLDDTGALQLADDGVFYPLRRFSGGEQDLANLCLRIALSRAVSRQRGTEAGFIILDEVFGSQDLERREQLIEQLKELRNDFRQVFVVSHFDDVVEECDLQIDVARSGGMSTAVPHRA